MPNKIRGISDVKIGDTVTISSKITHSQVNWLPVMNAYLGHTGKVTEVFEHPNKYLSIRIEGSTWWYPMEAFTKVGPPTPEFRVGDRVKVVRAASNDRVTWLNAMEKYIGNSYTICEVSPDTEPTGAKSCVVKLKEDRLFWFPVEALELILPAPASVVPETFKKGDMVRVIAKDPHRLPGEAPWNPAFMDQYLDGKTYLVEDVAEAGVLLIREARNFWFPRASLKLASTTQAAPIPAAAGVFKAGDLVKVVRKDAPRLNREHQWVDGMDKYLDGAPYKVERVTSYGVLLEAPMACRYYFPQASLELYQTSTTATINEEEMTMNTTNTVAAVATKTFIFDKESSTVSDEDIFNHIRTLEAEIKHYEAMENKPKKVEAKIDHLKSEIKALVKFVDERE